VLGKVVLEGVAVLLQSPHAKALAVLLMLLSLGSQ
jgi:hypothetical protein